MFEKTQICLFAATAFGFAAIAGFPAKNLLSRGNGETLSAETVGSAGGGALWGILGGYRSLVSDFAWIKGYIDWERKDVAGCMSAIDLATKIDPAMITFWTQGAAMIAFDTPHWLLQQLPPKQRGESALRLLKKRQAAIALNLVERGLKLYPDNEQLWLQKGQIAISVGDDKLAEDCYARLASRPDPSVYSRRIYASLLAKNGKLQKSIDVLESVLSETEADSPLKKLLEDQIARTRLMLKKTQ